MPTAPDTFAAYVLAIESIPERMTDARALMASLESLGNLQEIALAPAIFWKDEESIVRYLTRYSEHTFNQKYLKRALMGQLAVTLSHMSIWRRLLRDGHQGALVFEDDIFINDVPRLIDIVSELKNRPEWDWVRIHLLKMYRRKILLQKVLRGKFLRRGRENLFIDDPMPWGFAGYYVSRSGAEKMLGYCRKIATPIDWIPPIMKRKNLLETRAVTDVVVEHHAFEGNVNDLRGRHQFERRPEVMQKSASTINTSPRVAERAEIHGFISMLQNVEELHRSGFTVLKGVFSTEDVAAARRQVLANRGLFKNTRPSPSAGHLAGFHRFPALESLHTMLTGNPVIQDLLKCALKGEDIRTIGLSDITINRSQQWHKDLLRGEYQRYLAKSLNWDMAGAEVYKVLFYLQDGASLQIIEGSHLEPVVLDDDRRTEPNPEDQVRRVPVEVGDVVVMDIRCSHCGADEAVYASGKWDDDPRILVSTALGGIDSDLTKTMERGNFQRMMDWMERHP